MTLEALVDRMRALGFMCVVHTYEGVTKMGVWLLPSTPGNRIPRARTSWLESMESAPIEVDGPGLDVTIMDGVIYVSFAYRIPGPPEMYRRELRTYEELYEELLHFWFDADSPMSAEEGFVAGPGRPTVPAPPVT